ncbi:hypothetical protein BACI71_40171 [Bacillus mycoides]|uniref:Uncharacterized protein n=1 Tax=Bacillus mycoides TaxID=1405 RepID=A0A653ZJ69_BACMY|nr:hypothetical protein BACI71_40171 [Bacillus mycoides]
MQEEGKKYRMNVIIQNCLYLFRIVVKDTLVIFQTVRKERLNNRGSNLHGKYIKGILKIKSEFSGRCNSGRTKSKWQSRNPSDWSWFFKSSD